MVAEQSDIFFLQSYFFFSKLVLHISPENGELGWGAQTSMSQTSYKVLHIFQFIWLSVTRNGLNCQYFRQVISIRVLVKHDTAPQKIH